MFFSIFEFRVIIYWESQPYYNIFKEKNSKCAEFCRCICFVFVTELVQYIEHAKGRENSKIEKTTGDSTYS